MTVQELIDKATLQAWPDPNGAPARVELVANSLLSQVFEDVAKSFTSEGKTLPRLVKTLTFTDGVATLSTDVLTGYWSDAVLYDPADSTKEYVYIENWEDFIRIYDDRIGYFTIVGTSVYLIEPGSEYEEGAGEDGDRTLVVSGVPSVPASASTTISASAEFTNAALNLLVERLRGAPAA